MDGPNITEEETLMRISIADAEGRLAELVRLAETGNEVVLTREGEGAVCLIPIAEKPKPSAAEKKAVLDSFLNRMASKPVPATEEAARSQDFLYDENGLPG
jgi:prevent-host-death family protein